MIKKAIVIILVLIFFVGCANTASQKHQARLQELDSQYKSGQIDAVQYQAKYSEEVEDYNSRRIVAANLIGHDR